MSAIHTLRNSCLALCCLASTATASILTGSGPNLPIPAPNPAWPPGVSPVQTDLGSSFIGVWGTAAHADWVGFFTASGPIPSSLATGMVRYDFTTLPLGYLPAGTFMIFGDVDGGSTNAERFDLTAYDNTSAVITSEWLGATTGPNSVHSVRGPGTGTAGAVLPGNLPGWSWQGTNPNGYHITGGTVTGGNPNVAVALVTNQPIYSMDLNKPTTHYGFGLQAPVAVPEPGTLGLVALAGLGLAVAARRRRET